MAADQGRSDEADARWRLEFPVLVVSDLPTDDGMYAACTISTAQLDALDAQLARRRVPTPVGLDDQLKHVVDEWGALGALTVLLDTMDRDQAWRLLDAAGRYLGERPAPEECAERATPELAPEREALRSVPYLLERLTDLAREAVYLWHNPERNKPWAVWTGAPCGTGGGEWGAGATAGEAIQDAYERIVAAIFAGRIER